MMNIKLNRICVRRLLCEPGDILTLGLIEALLY